MHVNFLVVAVHTYAGVEFTLQVLGNMHMNLCVCVCVCYLCVCDEDTECIVHMS